MIFKVFDGDEGISSKIGVLNRSFSEITKAYEKAKEVTSKNNGQSFLKNFVDNLKIDVNEVGDLYKKFIVTQKDIEPFLKSIDVYDGFDDNQAKIVLNDLKTQKDLVDDNKSSWDKYYETLKNKPGMEWMLDIQLGRRNLSPIQRIAVAEKYRPIYEKMAKENLSTGGRNGGLTTQNKPLTNLSNPSSAIDTTQKLAKIAGVSEKTYRMGAKVLNSDNEDVKNRVLSGETSISAGYREHSPLDPKPVFRRV